MGIEASVWEKNETSGKKKKDLGNENECVSHFLYNSKSVILSHLILGQINNSFAGQRNVARL